MPKAKGGSAPAAGLQRDAGGCSLGDDGDELLAVHEGCLLVPVHVLGGNLRATPYSD